MRLLALTNLYPNPLQPHRAPFNRQQFRALASEHQVQVIAPIAWTSEWAARRGQPGGTLSPDRTRVVDGMVVHHPRYVFTPKALRGLYGRFYLESVRACFERAVNSFRPNVVLGCWAYPDGWAAVRLARDAGLPVAIKIHGSDVLVAGARSDRRTATVAALTEADAVIAVSGQLADRARALGAAPSRVHIVHNGVDDRLFNPGCREPARRSLGIEPAEPLILFVGNLVPVKGVDILIDSMASLRRTNIRVRCAIVGDGPLRRRLQDQAARLGLAECMRFVGVRPLEELPAWYRSADLVVLPSRSEGIPNVLLEAAACGTRFIASDVGGIPEIAHPSALVPAGDAGSLAGRIRAALAPGSTIAPLSAHPASWRDSAAALAAVLGSVAATPMRGATHAA
jgi:glycosyltransferase involved in cell wall biosynthesis